MTSAPLSTSWDGSDRTGTSGYAECMAFAHQSSAAPPAMDITHRTVAIHEWPVPKETDAAPHRFPDRPSQGQTYTRHGRNTRPVAPSLWHTTYRETGNSSVGGNHVPTSCCTRSLSCGLRLLDDYAPFYLRANGPHRPQPLEHNRTLRVSEIRGLYALHEHRVAVTAG